MKCNWNSIDLGWRMGSVDNMAKEAIEIATLLSTKVSFDFNGVKVNVTSQSDCEGVAMDTLNAVRFGKTSVFGKGW